MLPPDAFHDLVDLGVSFDVVQPVEPGPANVYRVAPAPGGLLRLKGGVGDEDLDTMWTGPARGVISAINVLLLREWGLARQGVRLPVETFIDEGKVCRFEIRPTGGEASRRRLKPFRVESEILYADLPDREERDVVVAIACQGRKTLHLLRTAGTPGLFPVERLSPNALPHDLHAKLAAKGHYVESFVALNGREALADARREAEAGQADWESRAAAAARRAAGGARRLNPGLDAVPSMGMPKAVPVSEPKGRPDGLYPFAFAHRVEASWGTAFVKSEGKVRIASQGPGTPAAISGEFLVPKRSSKPRPLLTNLDLHAVEGALFSRLDGYAGQPLPAKFGRADDLEDVLMWRAQPADGGEWHPLVQASDTARPGMGRPLCMHVCPPHWASGRNKWSQEPEYVMSSLYGGLAGLTGMNSQEVRLYMERHREAGPPAVVEEWALDGRLAEAAAKSADGLRDEIAKSVEGSLALVDGEVALWTSEPCWKLVVAPGGDLRLDLYLSPHPHTGNAIEPTLFFALDETEARESATEALLAGASRPAVRQRGRLDRFEGYECGIDGRSTSIAHLAAGLRESLHHAAKVLPGEAAQAALDLLAALGPNTDAKAMGFEGRGTGGREIATEVVEGWDRLAALAGDAIAPHAASPWLARLSGHGCILRHLAEAPAYEMGHPPACIPA